jgi:alginate O-acetyltransferase complex protein AlgI
MVFSSTVFLFLFLPLVLGLYFIIKPAYKNTLLLIGSLVFYAWGEPKYVAIMLLSIILNYIFALLIDSNREKKSKIRLILAVSIAANLLILGYFKYAGLLVDSINKLLGTSLADPEIPLPIGISFFTFQAMSYVIDVYRKDSPVQRNPLNLALYISFFPQLIAGPIVRYQTIAEQLVKRKETLNNFGEGTKRFIIGLSKKVFIANNCGFVADQIFAQQPADMSTGLAWIGIIAYSLQIYFDFSGYSDMAIGLARMFGFTFLENFNYPYISKSITEFWRRWHISLSSWFRDYLYIPLGGNRHGVWKTYRNLLIVWCATGFWHGASWTFLAWGFYYAVIIMLERAFLGRWIAKIPSVLQHIYSLVLVMVGWVFFRSETFTYAFSYLKTMFGLSGAGLWDAGAAYYLSEYGVVLVLAMIGSTPLVLKALQKLSEGDSMPRQAAIALFYSFILLLSIVTLVTSTFNPFIYFRF